MSVQLKGKRFVSLPQRTLVIKRIRPVIEPNPSPLFLSLSPSHPCLPPFLHSFLSFFSRFNFFLSCPVVVARPCLFTLLHFLAKTARQGRRPGSPTSMLISFFTPLTVSLWQCSLFFLSPLSYLTLLRFSFSCPPSSILVFWLLRIVTFSQSEGEFTDRLK